LKAYIGPQASPATTTRDTYSAVTRKLSAKQLAWNGKINRRIVNEIVDPATVMLLISGWAVQTTESAV